MTTFTPINHGVHPDIKDERDRQIYDEGYDSSHDRGHAVELLAAARSYAVAADKLEKHPHAALTVPPNSWPWDATYWKLGTPERMRQKAGALALAALDELARELDA